MTWSALGLPIGAGVALWVSSRWDLYGGGLYYFVPDAADGARYTALQGGVRFYVVRGLPPSDRVSCCGPALGFQDGGGSYITFHYSAPFTIQTGSFVSFKVNGYGSDFGQLFKYVSADGTNFSPAPGSGGQCPMGEYVIPLPTGATEIFFRLQVGSSAGLYDGIIVDSFHAVLYDTPQTPAVLQEGGGSVCIFNAEPFCGSPPRPLPPLEPPPLDHSNLPRFWRFWQRLELRR